MADSWQEGVDPATGRIYYANISTKETQWKQPASWQKNPKTYLPPGWNKCIDLKTQRTYYYNNPQKSHAWDRPLNEEGFTLVFNDEGKQFYYNAKSKKSALRIDMDQYPGWQQCLDPSTFATYYFNTQTQENSVTPGEVTEIMSFDLYPSLVPSSKSKDNDSDLDEDFIREFDKEVETSTSPPPVERKTTSHHRAANMKTIKKRRKKKKRLQCVVKSPLTILLPEDTLNQYNYKNFLNYIYPPQSSSKSQKERKKVLEEWSSYSVKNIKCSVSDPLNKDSHFLKQCLQCFKNITSYMKDRKSSKDAFQHLHKLMDTVHHDGEYSDLQDEVFCQVIKQTHEHPRIECEKKGWELMTVFCSMFPPKKGLQNYVIAHCQRGSSNKNIEVQSRAEYCMQQLQGSIANGPRKVKPGHKELNAMMAKAGVHLNITAPNGNVATTIFPQTTVLEAVDNLSVDLNVPRDQNFKLLLSASEFYCEKLRRIKLQNPGEHEEGEFILSRAIRDGGSDGISFKEKDVVFLKDYDPYQPDVEELEAIYKGKPGKAQLKDLQVLQKWSLAQLPPEDRVLDVIWGWNNTKQMEASTYGKIRGLEVQLLFWEEQVSQRQ